VDDARTVGSEAAAVGVMQGVEDELEVFVRVLLMISCKVAAGCL